eukprot:6524288-Ditylum_brightwellii.AAC.1
MTVVVVLKMTKKASVGQSIGSQIRQNTHPATTMLMLLGREWNLPMTFPITGKMHRLRVLRRRDKQKILMD